MSEENENPVTGTPQGEENPVTGTPQGEENPVTGTDIPSEGAGEPVPA